MLVEEDVCPLTLATRHELGADAYTSAVDEHRLYSRQHLRAWLKSSGQQRRELHLSPIYTSPLTRRDMHLDAVALGLIYAPAVHTGAQHALYAAQWARTQYVAHALSLYSASVTSVVVGFVKIDTTLPAAVTCQLAIIMCAAIGSLIHSLLETIENEQKALPPLDERIGAWYRWAPWLVTGMSVVSLASTLGAGIGSRPWEAHRIVAGVAGGIAIGLIVAPLGYNAAVLWHVKRRAHSHRAIDRILHLA